MSMRKFDTPPLPDFLRAPAAAEPALRLIFHIATAMYAKG